MDMKDYMERSKEAWKVAATFPADKCAVYPEHSLVQEFSQHRDSVVLEYGSGPGADAYEYLKNCNVVFLCDIVASNLDQAKINLTARGIKDNAIYVPLQESYPLPFGDTTFDVVNSHGVLHHIPDAVEVVKEFYRVLRPGGLCYIMLYTEFLHKVASGLISQLVQEGLSPEEAFGWFTDGKGTPYSVHYTEETGEQLLTQAGFVVEYHTLYNNDQFRTFKATKPIT